jgi:hypothetical protein
MKYTAFISYNSKDDRWAKWLQREVGGLLGACHHQEREKSLHFSLPNGRKCVILYH